MADTLKTLSLDEQFEQMKDVTFEDAFASVFGGVQTPQQTPEQAPEQNPEQAPEQNPMQQSETLLPSDIPEFSSSSGDGGNSFNTTVDNINMSDKDRETLKDFMADPPRVSTRQGADPFKLPSSLPEGLFDTDSNPAAFQTAQKFASQFGGSENDPVLKALQELPDRIVQALRNG